MWRFAELDQDITMTNNFAKCYDRVLALLNLLLDNIMEDFFLSWRIDILFI